MEIFKLHAEVRDTRGKTKARHMRREGKVPGIVYGHGDNVSCTLKERDLERLLITPKVYLIELELEGKVEHVILKDVQYHPVSDRPLHIDFYRYVPEEPIVMAIPVVLEGFARGVKAGGRLQQGVRRLRVKGMPADLPDTLGVDVTNLRIGDVLLVGAVSFPGLEVVDTKTLVVARIRAQRGAEETLEDEEEESSQESTDAPAEGESSSEG